MRLALPDFDQTFTIGPIEIADTLLTAGQLAGSQIPQVGAEVNPRPISLTFPLTLPGLVEMRVISGGLRMHLRNSLPVELSTVRMVLLAEDGQVVTSSRSVQLATGDSVALSLSLRSRRLVPMMSVGLIAQTAAAADLSGALAVSVRTESLSASYYESSGLAWPLNAEWAVPLPTIPYEIHAASVRSGQAVVEVTSHLDVGAQLQVFLDGLVDASGTPSAVNMRLTPRQTYTDTLDLAGYELRPSRPGQLSYRIAGTTMASDTAVAIRQTDQIDIRVTPLGDIVLESLEGIADGVRYVLPPTGTAVGFPRGLDQLEFRESSMIAWLSSAVNVDGVLRLDIAGVNDAGERDSLTTETRFGPGQRHQPVQIVVVPESARLTSFLSLLPTLVSVRPTLFLGDGVGPHSIAAEDWASVDSLNIRTGNWFRILAPTRIENKPERRSLPKGARQRVRSDIQRVRIETTVASTVPLTARVRLHLAGEADSVFTAPDLIVPSVGAYEIIGSSGSVELHVSEILLAHEELLLLSQPQGFFSGTLIEFEATEGDVRVHESDQVVVTSRAFVDYEINH